MTVHFWEKDYKKYFALIDQILTKLQIGLVINQSRE